MAIKYLQKYINPLLKDAMKLVNNVACGVLYLYSPVFCRRIETQHIYSFHRPAVTDVYDALTPPPPLSILLIFKGLVFICSTYLYAGGNHTYEHF